MLEMLVLGMLAEGPLTGYALKKRIENGPGVFIKVSFGSLYPLLARLCEKGDATMEAKTEGGRVKKYYTLTPAGHSRFAAWLRQPVDVREADNQRLARIYFFDSLEPPARAARLAEYREAVSGYLRELYARRDALQAKAGQGKPQSTPAPGGHYFKLATLYYGICALRETQRWCDCLIEGQPLDTLLPGTEREV